MRWTQMITRDGNLTGPGDTDEGNQESGNVNKGCEQKRQQEQNNSRKFQTIEGNKHGLYERTCSGPDVTLNLIKFYSKLGLSALTCHL